MSEEQIKCINNLCNFPSIYKSGDKSPVDIIMQSGYLDFYDLINESDIASYLNTIPDIIEDWIQFSEDIRHTPVWGFKTNSQSQWIVFYVDKSSIKQEISFENKFDACALMIKMTVEGIRNSIAGSTET